MEEFWNKRLNVTMKSIK